MKHSRTEMVTITSKILFPLRQQLEVAVVDGARALAVNTSRCKRDAFKLENISWHFANGKDEDDMGFHALQILASCSPGDTWTLLIWSVPQLFLRLQTSCWATALGANDLKSSNWSISCKKNEENANLVDDMPRNFDWVRTSSLQSLHGRSPQGSVHTWLDWKRNRKTVLLSTVGFLLSMSQHFHKMPCLSTASILWIDTAALAFRFWQRSTGTESSRQVQLQSENKFATIQTRAARGIWNRLCLYQHPRRTISLYIGASVCPGRIPNQIQAKWMNSWLEVVKVLDQERSPSKIL